MMNFHIRNYHCHLKINLINQMIINHKNYIIYVVKSWVLKLNIYYYNNLLDLMNETQKIYSILSFTSIYLRLSK